MRAHLRDDVEPKVDIDRRETFLNRSADLLVVAEVEEPVWRMRRCILKLLKRTHKLSSRSVSCRMNEL